MVVAVVVYAAMWVGWVHGWAWLTAVDNWFLGGCHRVGIQHPGWITAWNVFCTVLGPAAFRVFGLAVIIWLLVRRYLRAAVFLVISMEFSAVVTEVAKRLADRPRPATATVHAYGTSFPSGHALGVTVSVLALLAVTLPLVAARWRTPLIVAGAGIVVAIGIGRVALNVHHPSDVVAGWALGYLYYQLCSTIVRALPLDRITSRDETREVPDRGH
jgi:membrane-associated phospholipid phosphatase